MSCGVYGFPADRATRLAVTTIRQRLALARSVCEVVLVGIDDAMTERWRAALDEDPANGWDAVADRLIAGREASTIGVDVLRAWARDLRPGAHVLDLGCGSGVPVSRTLVQAGVSVAGVDASPRMVAAYRERFPDAPVACEAAASCTFFGRAFDAVVAVGLIFVLDDTEQLAVIATSLGRSCRADGSSSRHRGRRRPGPTRAPAASHARSAARPTSPRSSRTDCA